MQLLGLVGMAADDEKKSEKNMPKGSTGPGFDLTSLMGEESDEDLMKGAKWTSPSKTGSAFDLSKLFG